jgi:hypothetical protein
VLALVPIEIGQVVLAGAAAIEALPASHTVPALGYAVSARARPEAGAWVFTGDTGPNPLLWERLAAMTVHSLVIETAFGDDEQALAAHQPATCAPPCLRRRDSRQLPARPPRSTSPTSSPARSTP